MRYLEVCPNKDCGANLIASEIPADKRCTDACEDGFCPTHAYGKNSRYFYKSVGFYANDRTLFYFCPDCNAAWHRFPPAFAEMRHYAERHMKQEGKVRYEASIDTLPMGPQENAAASS